MAFQPVIGSEYLEGQRSPATRVANTLAFALGALLSESIGAWLDRVAEAAVSSSEVPVPELFSPGG